MNDYEKFKVIYDEIDELIAKQVASSDEEFITWYTKTERFIRKKYGDSPELKDFTNTSFTLMVFTFNETRADYVRACKRGLESTKAVFKVYLDEMKEEVPTTREVLMKELIEKDSKAKSCEKVFIVHGHDGALKEAVARLIEKQGIEAIILSEQANKGATIIEKFEANSDVGAAICLFTADDEGKANKESEYHKRARQNVVFETGYFMGKLGRQNVIMIADSEIEIPSDMQGVVYSNNNYWQFDVLKELKEIGFSIDMNKVF